MYTPYFVYTNLSNLEIMQFNGRTHTDFCALPDVTLCFIIIIFVYNTCKQGFTGFALYTPTERGCYSCKF